MKILLCGEAGTGKTDIAYSIYKKLYYVHVVDSDEVRKVNKNFDYTMTGRKLNMNQCQEAGNFLASLNRHTIFAVQAPNKTVRDTYFKDCKIIRLTNSNNTKIIKNEIKPTYDYSDIKTVYDYQDIKLNIYSFIKEIFPKVLIIGRFQPHHKGHDLVFQQAIKESPYIDVGIRKENGDIFTEEEGKNNILKKYPGINKVFITPRLNENNWDFIKNYDIIVQGNPEVINRIKPFIKGKLVFVPWISNISGTKIRSELINK